MAWYSGSFDYGQTCPDIDKSISEFQSIIVEKLKDLVEEIENEEDIEDLVVNYSTDIYEEFEQNFEAVRKTNDDMRKEAEIQISNLKEEVEDLKNKVSSLEYELGQL